MKYFLYAVWVLQRTGCFLPYVDKETSWIWILIPSFSQSSFFFSSITKKNYSITHHELTNKVDKCLLFLTHYGQWFETIISWTKKTKLCRTRTVIRLKFNVVLIIKSVWYAIHYSSIKPVKICTNSFKKARETRLEYWRCTEERSVCFEMSWAARSHSLHVTTNVYVYFTKL